MRKLLALTIAVAACSDATGPTQSVITALVNGAPFTGATDPQFGLGLLDTVNMSLNIIGSQALAPLVYANVALTLRDFHGAGRYQTCATSNSLFGVYFKVDQQDSTPPLYTTDSVCGGEVDIDLYVPSTLTISGTFHFVAVNQAISDTARITDGRFSGKVGVTGIILDSPRPPFRPTAPSY